MSDYKNNLKRIIKTGMNALHIDDATYRDMLERVSMNVSGKSKNSIKNMTIDELNAVINELRKKGFETKRGKSGNGKDKFIRDNEKHLLDRSMMETVKVLWVAMHKQGFVSDGSDRGLHKFVRKIVNRQRKNMGKKTRIINLFGANEEELHQVTEILKNWQQRELEKLAVKST